MPWIAARRESPAKLRKLQAENLSPTELEKRRAVLLKEFDGQQRELEKTYRAASSELSQRVLEPLLPHAAKAKPVNIGTLNISWGQFACPLRSLKDAPKARRPAAGQGPVLDTPGPAGSHHP